MTDLTSFLGSTAVVGTSLVYVVDGMTLPAALATFTEISPSSATLVGKAIPLFGQTIVAGSLSITLIDASHASLTVKWQFDGGQPTSNTIQATYAVNPNNPNQLDFNDTESPFATFFIAQVPGSTGGVTNTEIFAKDGMFHLAAVLEPSS